MSGSLPDANEFARVAADRIRFARECRRLAAEWGQARARVAVLTRALREIEATCSTVPAALARAALEQDLLLAGEPSRPVP